MCCTLIALKNGVGFFLGKDQNIYKIDQIKNPEYKDFKLETGKIYWIVYDVAARIIRNIKAIVPFEEAEDPLEVIALIEKPASNDAG